MGEDPEKRETVGGAISVDTSSVYALPSPEEELDEYVQQIRAKRRYYMPDACCPKCGKIFKPLSLDRNEQSWPPYAKVPCPKCKSIVTVFFDKKLERDFSSGKLLEESELGKFQKEFVQFKTEVLTRLEALERGQSTALEARAKELETRFIAFLNKMSEKQTGESRPEEKPTDKKRPTEGGIRYS